MPLLASWQKVQLSCLALAILSLGSEVINHDDIFSLPSNATELQYAWQPWFMVDSTVSCVPFPAVDAEGRLSGGLAPKGDVSGDCQMSPGQTYVRTRLDGGKLDAIMYSWFFPKDQRGFAFSGEWNGARYDWASAILFFDQTSTEHKLLKVCLSQKEDYWCRADPPFLQIPGQPTRYVLVEYAHEDHQQTMHWHVLLFAEAKDLKMATFTPIVDWEALPSAARESLNHFSFGDDFKHAVPFNDDHFESRIYTARYAPTKLEP